MSAYRALKAMYHGLFPTKLRTFLVTNPIARKPRMLLSRAVERFARHDEIYDRAYFEVGLDGIAATSAPHMVRSLVQEVHPSSVVDVGCGTGQVLMSFRESGVSAVRGLEYSAAALGMCQQRGLEVKPFDIESNARVDWRADLVVSTEVAEHLPKRCADHYVDLLISIADTVFLTAATPDQGGTDHVNEQPNAYWIEKFRGRSFEYDEATSMRWRQEWLAAGVAGFYCNSAMLFRKVK
jgi:SAM-dependent methyltransferase